MDTFYYLVLISKLVTGCAQSDMTSLTFVIDTTNSMNSEIRQVENGSLNVYEAVKKSNSSTVKNYILVTFGDSSAEIRTNTEDGNVLKTELSMVHAYGGGDCPEAVFKGIRLAAKESLPGSNIYVFTDAAPKDYLKFNAEVRDICHKKQLQIVFLLTGKCSNKKPKDNMYYAKYREVALATSGQVFNLRKDDIVKILSYITSRVSDRKATLTCRKFGPDHHKVEFTIDDKIKDVVVSVSGANMALTGPGGKKVTTSDIVKITNTSIVKITDAKPGVYTVDLFGEGMVTVTGTTNLFFNYGFLGLEVDSLDSTASQPISGEKTHLYIKLSTEDPVILKKAQILDLDEKVITDHLLRVINKTENLYETDLFVSPENIFKIAIEGYDTKSKIFLKRVSPTPVVPQKLPDKIVNVKPTVSLETSDLHVEFEKSVKLKCRVNGYPKPTITWMDLEEKTILSSEVTTYEIPYDFISILTVEKINKNHTYECQARNFMGQNSQVVNVRTKRKIYFELTCPEHFYSVRFDSEVKLVCKTEANPPAKIKWYKNGKLVKGDNNTIISKDGTSLTILRMNRAYRNHPIECRVYHELKNSLCSTKLEIIGRKPKLNTDITAITAMKGSNVNISCIPLNGDKPIVISWKYKSEGSPVKTLSFTGETLLIKDVLVDDEGYYECKAENYIGKVEHGVNLHVEYPPSVTTKLTTNRVKRKSYIRLDCWIDGRPKPTVRWYKDSKIKLSTSSYTGSYPFSDYNVMKNSVYKCEAQNKYGTVNKTIAINVYEPVTIEVPKVSTINALLDGTVELDCIADGYPKPVLQWEHRSSDHVVTKVSSSASGSKKIQNLQIYHEGLYTCIATNIYGSTNITYIVKVNEPVKIISRPTTFEATVGDPVFEIPCSTQGRPKPSISWLRNGYLIISDTSSSSVSLNYNIKADGTLLIYNINEHSSAIYECHAKNIVNEDKMTIKLIVHPYTYKLIKTSQRLMLEEGTTNSIECEGANEERDSIRWYKGSDFTSPTKLVLENVSSRDTGLYMCRIFKNGLIHTADYSVFVKVGTKPKFTTNESLNKDLVGKEVFLKCDANGKPVPKSSWWYNDEDKLLSSAFTYITKVPGKYLCIVSNEFGTINRTFTISEKECNLDIIKDFIDRPPLILEPGDTLQVPKFEVCNNYMRIPSSRQISLHCPLGSSFENFKTSLLYAVCINKKKFRVNGKKYNFSELKCQRNWRPTTHLQKMSCLSRANKRVIIGYTTRRGFLSVYNVCYNKKRNIAIYAEKILSHLQCSDDSAVRSVTATSVFRLENNNWLTEHFIPYLPDELYSCAYQERTNPWHYRRWFGTGSRECSIAKRPLLHPRHLIGLPQGAAYSYVNVVPQIKQFMDNWDDVERRIDLRRREIPGLKVFSGSLNHIPGEERFNVSYIMDRFDFTLPVPLYLWKTVEFVAIVQINIPNIKKVDVKRFVFCEDICHTRTWTMNIAWRSIEKGYIFCCDQSEFVNTAGFY